MRRRDLFRLSGALALAGSAPALFAACASDGAAASEARSDRPRATPDDPGLSDLATLATGNAAFAWDLQRAAGSEGNLVTSPYSISQTLAMAWAGARGETASEMAAALRFGLSQERLHPAFNALDLALPPSSDAFRLSIANAAWGQTGMDFEAPFLDTLARYYGAGLRLVDFGAEPEPSRQTINRWVEDQTASRIEELLPEGSVTPDTRLVLTNAVWFKALWEHPFRKDRTEPRPFHALDGRTVDVPAMSQRGTFAHHAGPDYTAVDLPYRDGRTSMVILMPAAGNFTEFEAGLDGETLSAALAEMTASQVILSLPKFTFRSELSLVDALKSLGMRLAFVPPAEGESGADFSAITGARNLFISDVVHEAFIQVDEEGTEAAAATGAIFEEVSAPPAVTIDRPFVFVIRDRETGATLFSGRVTMPEAATG